MRSYDPPPSEGETDALTPSEAQARLNQMHADFAADPDHPFYNKGHPQHKDFAAHSWKLNTILAEDEAEKREVKDAQDVVDFLAGNNARQDAVRKEAAAEVALLKDLGFEGIEVPADIQPYRVTAWKMQRLNAQNDLQQLTPLMEKELRGLHATSETLDAFRSYVNVKNLDPALREGIFEKLIAWIHAANAQRYGKPKPTTTPEDMEIADDDLS